MVRRFVTVAVEGDSEVPIIDRILDLVGIERGVVYGLKGKDFLDNRLLNYNQAARHSGWLILRDLDHDAGCAPALIEGLLPSRSSGMLLRVPVRAVEAWLLADRERVAEFLGVRQHLVPVNPEQEEDPKGFVVSLARRSRRRDVREDMVPQRGTSSRVGPGYSARIMEFAGGRWRPRVAARRSPSLAACIAALRRWRAG